MNEPLFRRDGDGFVPTGHARGPWDPMALHGGGPAALLATELEALAGGMQLVRLTYEFLGPVPLAPLTAAARVTKPGRRFQLLEAELLAGGRPVMVVRAAAMRRGDVTLPDRARRSAPPPGDGPDAAAPGPGAFEGPEPEALHLTGMDIRFVPGSRFGAGPSQAWFRLRGPLVDDAPPSPVARVCLAADFPNGISAVLDLRTHLFVNTDLAISIVREPVGEWVLLDADTWIEPTGIGAAQATLYDERGLIGTSRQTLFVQER